MKRKTYWACYLPDDMDPYERLALSIVILAVDDYRARLRGHNPATCTHLEQHLKLTSREAIETFFRSKWFGFLTEIDPEDLMRRLRKEATTERYRKVMRPHKPSAREASILTEAGLDPDLYWIEGEKYPYLYVKDKKHGDRAKHFAIDMERKMPAYDRPIEQ